VGGPAKQKWRLFLVSDFEQDCPRRVAQAARLIVRKFSVFQQETRAFYQWNHGESEEELLYHQDLVEHV